MENLISQFGSYGFGGLMVGLIVYLLWKQNEKMGEKIEKQSDWQLQFIENNTKATIGQTQAYAALTKAFEEQTKTIVELDRTVRDRVGK